MAEFQELVNDAPKFASMERGELVAYAYGMYAAGAKTDAENAKLRKLASKMARIIGIGSEWCMADCAREFGCDMGDKCKAMESLAELGIEVD